MGACFGSVASYHETEPDVSLSIDKVALGKIQVVRSGKTTCVISFSGSVSVGSFM
jgi:hypothetical protein